MRYAVLGGGKRVRPLLCHAAGAVFGVDSTRLDAPSVAVELIHAYSLAHDDLPCMDDDVLRRGKPTCHVEFDEATALLVGDALQAQAFPDTMPTAWPASALRANSKCCICWQRPPGPAAWPVARPSTWPPSASN